MEKWQRGWVVRGKVGGKCQEAMWASSNWQGGRVVSGKGGEEVAMWMLSGREGKSSESDMY